MLCVDGESRDVLRWCLKIEVFVSLCLLVLAFAVAPYDREIVLYLNSLDWGAFSQFQEQTLFDDGRFGGSDISLLFQLVFLVMSLLSLIPSVAARISVPLRRFALFVSLTTVYTGGILVQVIKFAWGRARPYIVFDDDGSLYSNWYEMGMHTLADGRFAGSFPSGHTASASIFFALMYLPIPMSRPQVVVLRAVIFLFAFAFFALMALGRTMIRAHFLTDCLLSGVVVLLSLALFADWLGLSKREASAQHFQSQPCQKKTLTQKFSFLVLGTLALGALLKITRELFIV